MPTQVDIMNMALQQLGAKRIQAASQNTPEAASVAAAWQRSVDTILRAHPWGFAQVWATLAPAASAPPFGFACAYRLPAECLYLIDVRPLPDLKTAPAPRFVVERYVYTDARPCYARMVARQADTSYWPLDFCQALGMLLAASIAPSIVRDEGQKVRNLLELYEVWLDKARTADAAESMAQEPAPETASPYLSARR